MINDFTCERLTADQVRLTWTVSSAANVSWVYQDGVCLLAGYLDGETTRTLDVNQPTGTCACYEVHEVADGVFVEPVFTYRNDVPTLLWDAVSGADSYRVYVTTPGDSERLVKSVAETGDEVYSYDCPVVLTNGWSKVRVTAVKNTLESTTVNFLYLTYGAPEAPSGVSFTNTAPGVFTLTVT